MQLKQIYDDICQLISIYKPDAIAVEDFQHDLKTGISVAHGRGVAILAGKEHGVPMFEYTPLQINRRLRIRQGREKQVMEMVRRLLSLDNPPHPDDAADALAVAICHARVSGSLLNTVGGNICSTI